MLKETPPRINDIKGSRKLGRGLAEVSNIFQSRKFPSVAPKEDIILNNIFITGITNNLLCRTTVEFDNSSVVQVTVAVVATVVEATNENDGAVVSVGVCDEPPPPPKPGVYPLLGGVGDEGSVVEAALVVTVTFCDISAIFARVSGPTIPIGSIPMVF